MCSKDGGLVQSHTCILHLQSAESASVLFHQVNVDQWGHFLNQTGLELLHDLGCCRWWFVIGIVIVIVIILGIHFLLQGTTTSILSYGIVKATYRRVNASFFPLVLQ